MFKRFLVMDLFHKVPDQDGEWVNVSDRLPDTSAGIFFVKGEKLYKCPAYFFMDKLTPLMRYFKDQSSYWWDKDSKEPMYDVTHWMTVPETQEL